MNDIIAKLGSSGVLVLGSTVLFAMTAAIVYLDERYRRREKLSLRIATLAERGLRTHAPLALPKPVALRSLQPRFRLDTFVFGLDLWSPPVAGETRGYAVLSLAFLLALAPAKLLVTQLGASGWLSAPLLGVLITRIFVKWQTKRRQRELYRQFPDALGMIIRAIRVGIPVTRAIAIVAREAPQPTAAEFRRTAESLAIGVPLEEALQALVRRSGLHEFHVFATVLILQGQTGGSLAGTLENVADMIRRRIAVRARGLALAAEARTSAGILIGLPFLVIAALWIVSPAYIVLLFSTHAGNLILLAALALLCCGYATMHLLIRSSLA